MYRRVLKGLFRSIPTFNRALCGALRKVGVLMESKQLLALHVDANSAQVGRVCEAPAGDTWRVCFDPLRLKQGQ